MTNSISPEFKARLEKNKASLNIPRSNKVSEFLTEQILTSVQKRFELESREDALTIIALFSQNGGCSVGCDGNMPISYLGQEFRLSALRKVFSENNCKNGLRKFARTHGGKIYAICKVLDQKGNMYNKILRLKPNLSINDDTKYWLSDFQAFNEQAPSEARSLIISAFPKAQKKKKN